MVDTIVLILNKDTYKITEPDKFKPSATWLEKSTKMNGVQCKQYASKQEQNLGIYKPRLCLTNRFNAFGISETTLRVELSLPKLLFGNNFDELQPKHFSQLTDKLINILTQMGVETTSDTINKAPISAIHYSKNIPLTDGSTPYHYINKIKEADIKLSLDVNQTDYRNTGHSYKWHCNSYEVVFYDKIKDLEKAKQSSKRSVEKDSTLQLNIFNSLKKRKKFEILRMEVRLNKRQKIKQLFKEVGIKTKTLTFKSLFKLTISKKILLHYLDKLESKRSTLIDYKATNDKALISSLIFNNPKLTIKQILQMFGLKKLLESVNPRELRVMFANYNKRSWYRLIKEAQEIKLPSPQISFEAIRKCIKKYKPLIMDKFKKYF